MHYEKSPIISNPNEPETSETIVQQIDTLKSVQMHVSVVMGETTIPIKQVLALQKDSIVELDRNQSDDVDVYINSRLVAKGQLMAIDDEYAVRITRILDKIQQDGSLEKVFDE